MSDNLLQPPDIRIARQGEVFECPSLGTTPIMRDPLRMDVLAGARAMAEGGFTVSEILKAFFPAPKEEPAPYEPGTRQWLDWRITQHLDTHFGIPGRGSYSSTGFCGVCGACLVCGTKHGGVCPEWKTITTQPGFGNETGPAQGRGLSSGKAGETPAVFDGGPDQ
jgi:hypothetical protein